MYILTTYLHIMLNYIDIPVDYHFFLLQEGTLYMSLGWSLEQNSTPLSHRTNFQLTTTTDIAEVVPF